MSRTPPAPHSGGAGMRWLFFRASGRIGRRLFVLGWLLLTAVNGFFLAILLGMDSETSAFTSWSWLALAAGLATVGASAMLAVKRLHDIDQNGALAVLIFVPILSIVMLMALAVWPGTPGPNAYGDHFNGPSD